MKIVPIHNVSDFNLPLPIFTSLHLADAIGKDGEEFSILVGLEKKYIEQLKEYSLDKKDIDLQENTSDKDRFGKGSFVEWYAKNRTPFCLIHKRTDTLAAIVWLGSSELFEGDNNWHTIGWRSYNPFRGQGLMHIFSDFVIHIYMQKFNNIRLWGKIRKGNTGSISLATSLGFQVLKELSDDYSLVMIK